MGTDKKKIQILLSTYNGEKYLKKQLDSYVWQTVFPCTGVLIRDDGSTDHTVNILKEYEVKYGFTVIYGENIGINSSYRVLLEASDPNCQYFALSDQDDVWLPKKLEIALSRLNREDDELPLLFSSLSSITDENLNVYSTSIKPKRGLSFYNAMIQNVCPGHTQVFNSALRRTILQADNPGIHVLDWWVYMISSGLGKIIFEPDCTVMHRQHGGNAVGYERNPFKLLLSRIRRVHSQEAASITKQLLAFYEIYGERLSEDYLSELQGFLLSQSSLLSRFRYLRRARIYRQTRTETVLVRMLYLFGKYKLRDD